jgi:AAA15 family ATPase/GTPase
MLISFSVQNFGSIKDEVTLSFDATNSKDLEEYYIINVTPKIRLLKLGLIFGANASGKTTILKALDFLSKMIFDPLKSKNEKLDFEPFLFDKDTPKQPTIFKIEFVGEDNIKYLYEITFSQEAIHHEILYFYNPNKAIVFERQTNLEKQFSSIRFGSKIKISKVQKEVLEANTLWNTPTLTGYLKTNIESKELQIIEDWFSGYLCPLVKPNSGLVDFITEGLSKEFIDKKFLLELLSKADFKINDIKIESPEPERVVIEGKTHVFDDEVGSVSFQHQVNNTERYSLNFDQESLGTQRYFQFAGLLASVIQHPTLLLIDELESSLHPDLLEHFLLTFLANAKRSQLLVTTHYRELLMKREILREDAIWFTEKQANGATDLYSLSDFDSSVVRNTSSFYNAYKTGKLGATPNLGNYYLNTGDEEEE